MKRIEPKVVAYGMPNSALTGRDQALMMVRLDKPSDDQYQGALWLPLGIIEDTPYTVTEITLTVAQIADLARAVGLVIEEDSLPGEEEAGETEVTVRGYSSAQPVTDEETGLIAKYTHVAFFEEVPEEGVFPLGAAESLDANT